MSEETTEADVLAALADRHSDEKGWAFLTHVRSATGASARQLRTADAVAMQLWPSRGLELHGFEVKVTRSDLNRELKDPQKAELIARYCRRWWLAVPRGLCTPDEIPPAWGLYEIDGRGVGCTKPAEVREDVKAVDYPFLASLLRSTARADGLKATLERERQKARRKGYDEGMEAAEKRNGTARVREQLERLKAQVAEFEEELGVELDGINGRYSRHQPRDLAAALKVALEDRAALDRLERRRDSLLENIDRLATWAEDLR